MPVSQGDVLKGNRGVKPAAVRVLGTQGGEFVVEDADSFSAPRAITPAKLAADYGGDPTLPPSDEDILRRGDAAATEAAADALFRRTDHPVPRRVNIGEDLRSHVAARGHNPRSPEEIFDAAADAEAEGE